MILECFFLFCTYAVFRTFLTKKINQYFFFKLEKTRQSLANHICFCLLNIFGIMIFYSRNFKVLPFPVSNNLEFIYGSSSTLELLYKLQIVHHFQTAFFQVKNELSFDVWIHHICTLLLVLGSWFCKFHKIGASVMFLMDSTEFLIYFIRLIRTIDGCYLNDQTNHKITDVLQATFMPFLISFWFYFRILKFGEFILQLNLHVLPAIGWENFVFIFLLIILWILNVFWFNLILFKSAKFIFTKKK